MAPQNGILLYKKMKINDIEQQFLDDAAVFRANSGGLFQFFIRSQVVLLPGIEPGSAA